MLIFIKSIREIIGVDRTEIFGCCLMKDSFYIGIWLKFIKEDGWGWAGSTQITIFQKCSEVVVVGFCILNDFIEFVELGVYFMYGRVNNCVLH